MEQRSSVIVAVAGIFVVFCLCAVGVAVAVLFVGVPFSSSVSPVSPPGSVGVAVTVPIVVDAPPTETVIPPTETTISPTGTDAPAGITPIPTDTPTFDPTPDTTDDPNAQLRESIEDNVVEIRGLEPLEPVITTILTREELRQRVQDDFFSEFTPEDARDFTLTLYAFDFVSLDFDYYNFTIDLYSEQIAGFYDPETNEFVVVSDDDEFDVSEQLTYAHEYMHALQDQHFTLDEFDDDERDSEATAAFQALVEGEATYLQTLYLLEGYFTLEQMGELFELFDELESPILDTAPPVLANNLAFPYNQGYVFVEALYNEGGFEAIDAAWADPPLSTEHILHPERYLAGDLPQIVSTAALTDTLGAGWRQLDEDIFGEFFLREYLSQQLSATEVEVAATGWGGDRYAVYWNEAAGELVATLRLAWDTPQDGTEFDLAYGDYASAVSGVAGVEQADRSICWIGADVICLYELDDDSFIVRAPSLELVEQIVAAQ